MSESGKKKQTGMALVAVGLIVLAGVLVMWNYQVGPFKPKPIEHIDPNSLLTDEQRQQKEKDDARMKLLEKVSPPSGS